MTHAEKPKHICPWCHNYLLFALHPTLWWTGCPLMSQITRLSSTKTYDSFSRRIYLHFRAASGTETEESKSCWRPQCRSTSNNH